MNYKKIISLSAGTALLAGFALVTPALADTNVSVKANLGFGQGEDNGNRAKGMMQPMVSGTVTAISGNTITITGHIGGRATTTATVNYTVDATSATFRKNNATSTISSIVVGDKIVVQGTITGTNIVAKAVFDGVIMDRNNDKDSEKGGKNNIASSTLFTGNGQPVVAGTISAINGTVLTITTTSNVTYTIDSSNAKVVKGNSTVTLSDVSVGSKIVVQGVVNGNSITASTILDQSVSTKDSQSKNKGQSRGFFSSIGQFFSHLFGF